MAHRSEDKVRGWEVPVRGLRVSIPVRLPRMCAKSDMPYADHPKAMLLNGKLTALVFLPDKENGYYRSTRFDWPGETFLKPRIGVLRRIDSKPYSFGTAFPIVMAARGLPG